MQYTKNVLNKLLLGAIGIAIAVILLTVVFYLSDNYGNYKNKSEEINLLSVQKMDELSNADKYKYQKQMAAVIATKDFSRCEIVADSVYRAGCINNIAVHSAVESLDISYCQKIDNQLASRDNCERHVIFQNSVEKEDVEVCGAIHDQELREQCQDNFYLQTAFRKQDPSACELAPIERRNICHDNYLLSTKSFVQNRENFDCGSLKHKNIADDCLVLKEASEEQMRETEFCQFKTKSPQMKIYCDILNN